MWTNLIIDYNSNIYTTATESGCKGQMADCSILRTYMVDINHAPAHRPHLKCTVQGQGHNQHQQLTTMTHAHDALYIPHNNVRQMSYADDQASDITVKADMYDLHSAISN